MQSNINFGLRVDRYSVFGPSSKSIHHATDCIVFKHFRSTINLSSVERYSTSIMKILYIILFRYILYRLA